MVRLWYYISHTKYFSIPKLSQCIPKQSKQGWGINFSIAKVPERGARGCLMYVQCDKIFSKKNLDNVKNKGHQGFPKASLTSSQYNL